MKRFYLDAFLILIVVSIGSTLNQQQPESTIQQRIEAFNQQIEKQEVIEPPVHRASMYQIQENTAGQLGANISEMVIRVVEDSVRMIASAFGQ